MARLPSALDVPNPVGTRPSGLTLQVGDLGLGDAAKALESFGQAKDAADERVAGKLIQQQQTAYQPQFAERAAAYDGRESGFALKETAALDDAFTPLLEQPGLSEGVRWQLKRQYDGLKTRVGQQAINVESEKRAGVVAEQEKVKQEVRLGGSTAGFQTEFSKAYQARVDTYDGSQPDFAPGVLADFDTAAKSAVDAAPDDMKVPLQGWLAGKRVQIHAQALEMADKGHDAFVATSAQKTLDGMVNTVLTSPAAYETTVGDLGTAAAGVPAPLRRKFLDAAGSDLAAARIEGLITRGDTAQARAELSDGRFNKVLAPDKHESLLTRLDAAERGGPKTLNEWRQAFEADANLDAEATARSQGKTTGFSLQTIVGVFSPREVAAAEQKLKMADQVFAATGNLQAQSNEQLRQRATAAPPAGGTPELPAAIGLRRAGNLDPWHRPILKNPDGGYSTTSSISVGTTDGEVLIPTVVNGKRLTTAEAISHFKSTGENLGVFDTPAHADAYAQELHNRQAQFIEQGSGADYGDKAKAWELSRKAAAGELAAREKDPAAWAMASTTAGDTGAQLQSRWQAVTAADTEEHMGQAGSAYATLTLGLQMRAGVPRGTMRVFTKDEAAQFAQNFAKATPDQRPAQLRSLALLVAAMPSNVRMGDGTTVSARQMAAKELDAAGLGGADVAAIVDLAGDPGRLNLYADAASDPVALKPLTGQGVDAGLQSAVDERLSAFFQTANALPGSAELNAGRKARTLMVARHLMNTQGLSAPEAAKRATSDLTDGYRFVDGWRMPRAAADAPANLGGAGAPFQFRNTQGQTWELARRGAAVAMADLLRGDGALLTPAPGGPALNTAQRQALAADIVRSHGRWVTTENDGGLQLMVPDPRGWTPMADRNGQPVRLTWDQLTSIGGRGPGATPGSWLAPGPAAGAPPRVAPGKAQAAFAAAIEHRESSGQVGAVSSAGALGIRQLMPKTAEAAAQRLGIAFEPERLTTDAGYNRRLSDEEIRHLSNHFDGNIALVAAGYNAGPTAVDGWLKRFGDPRRGHVSVDQWVADIPVKETRDYVRAVLPAALANLRKG